MRITAAMLLLAAGSLSAQDARQWLNQGVAAFKNAQYEEAVADFQKAVDADPSFAPARLYLATAYMQQFIPGADTPANNEFAQRAEAEFRNLLAVDASNKVATASIASLLLNQKKWDDARTWYRQLLNIDPNNADAYYSLGFITWSQWYPAYGQARKSLGMKQEDPGPIADVGVRNSLRAQYWSMLDEGLWNLNKALEINPQYDDAMAYINLLIRERADLRDTKEEWAHDVAEADQWVKKVLAIKKTKAESRIMGAPLPPPPPPPAGVQRRTAQTLEPVSRMNPVYPPLAQQARIQGVVKFQLLVGEDGSVRNLQVISGHPLLIPAALDVVKQWRYRTDQAGTYTLAEVNFTLR